MSKRSDLGPDHISSTARLARNAEAVELALEWPEGCPCMVYFTIGELASAGLLSSPRIFPSSSA